MLEKIVSYFARRHLLTNILFIGVIVGGIFSWEKIKKEEMPDITFDRVRITALYPGATAEEVEHFVTKELEEELKGIDGIYHITSSSGQGSASILVEIEKDFSNKDEAITEIRNAALDADLPEDVRDKPSVRVFKTSKKAILDVAVFHRDSHLLDVKKRKILQKYALSLENQLLSLPSVNSINRDGYLQEEIQINVDPEQLKRYNIPLSQVRNAVIENHSRQPAGNIEAKNEPKVTINAQLDTVEKLDRLYVQAGFEGRAISLKEIARVESAFARQKEIVKVNGREAVLFSVVKNSGYGILESLDSVNETIGRFRENYLKDSGIEIVALDDESIDVRNRLSIISANGGIGFVLILFMLFLFLNKRSGLWVGMGIPFTVFFTLVCGMLMGYTINNTTLAAVIIVMGIVVDDAIVIAENIVRFRKSGLDPEEASVRGTTQVFLPVVASIVTTCIAFVPLYFSSGRFGQINSFIPPVIFLMLGASLIESLLILPGHMLIEIPWINSIFNRGREKSDMDNGHWFDRVEELYGRFMIKILPYKYYLFLFFITLLIVSVGVMTQKMKFVMFPNEETREIILAGELSETADRYETAKITKRIEDIIAPYTGKEVVGTTTGIARSRRGGAVEENKFRMIIEIVSKEERRISADELIELWQPEIGKIKEMKKLTVQKSRWGQSSGSPIEIIVQENIDELREKAADKLAELMKGHQSLVNVEIDRPVKIPEYKIDFRREKIKRLSINPLDISSTFRSALEGIILYELPMGDEEIDVRLSVLPDSKTDIEKIIDIPVENNRDYLVPLRDVVIINKTTTPNSIDRRDYRRVTTVYSDIKAESNETPLEIAEYLEKNIFPDVINSQPSTTLSFTGEVFDTRESGGDLKEAVVLVVLLIFAVLAVLFNSFSRPLVIMTAIPFGIVGVVLAFLLHGKELFGFYAAIGCLGLAGVVINDSIVMITKLDAEFASGPGGGVNEKIASVAQTRLKAVILTTMTTVAGVLPTAYGLAGYDAMLAEMMLALAWGLLFGTMITLVLVPCLYSIIQDIRQRKRTAE